MTAQEGMPDERRRLRGIDIEIECAGLQPIGEDIERLLCERRG